MRALFVCPDMRTGGAERHWATLTPALANAGLAVHVLCLSEEGGLFGALDRGGRARPPACTCTGAWTRAAGAGRWASPDPGRTWWSAGA